MFVVCDSTFTSVEIQHKERHTQKCNANSNNANKRNTSDLKPAQLLLTQEGFVVTRSIVTITLFDKISNYCNGIDNLRQRQPNSH